MTFIYKPKTKEQLKKAYNRRQSQGVNGFKGFDDFCDWYENQKQVCYYCGLTEIESQEISMTGILTSNRFPQKGKIGQGTSRAVWLEVDRLNPKELYSKDNCVMCCYFCNNDKSDVFDGIEYIKFFQNRVKYLRELIVNNHQNKKTIQ